MRFGAYWLVLALQILPVSCLALTHWVFPDGSGAYPTIQDAVDAAASGDTVTIADGVYQLDNEIGIYVYEKELVIRSDSGDPTACIIVGWEGFGGGRGFRMAFAGGRNGVIEGFTVTDTRASWGACINLDNSSTTIRNCVLKNGITTDSGGGGIWAGNNSHPLIEDCHIHHNEAYAYGGGAGINLNDGGSSIEIYHCIIEDNSGATLISGAGGVKASGPAIIKDCIIRRNSTYQYGGGLSCRTEATIENCLIADNIAGVGGGGFFTSAFDDGERVFRGCTFSGNSAPTGAAILNMRWQNFPTPPIFIDNSIIAFNAGGLAVMCSNAIDPVTVTCSNIYGNYGGNWPSCIQGQGDINGNFSLDPRFCAPYAGNYALDMESPCLPENNSCGVLIGAYGEGCDLTAALPGSAQPVPTVRSFPNPFNPETEIVFGLLSPEIVTIRIFDTAGRSVRDLLISERYPVGKHSVQWAGCDDRGEALPSGVYYCRVAIGNAVSSTKLTLLK